MTSRRQAIKRDMVRLRISHNVMVSEERIPVFLFTAVHDLILELYSRDFQPSVINEREKTEVFLQRMVNSLSN